VPLERSDEVVVDVSEPGLSDLSSHGRALSGSLVLVPEADAVGALGEDCASMAGVHPVFRSEDGALVVVLPEVRVEAEDPEALSAVRRAATNAHLTGEDEGRLVLAPDSGRGEDALALANQLAESGDLAADVIQARFLRIVPRPDTTAG
jgi:hypothetical protein